MEIKDTFVYQSIRRAAMQQLLSRRLIRFCVFLAFTILPILALFFASYSDSDGGAVLAALLVPLIFGFLLIFDAIALYRSVTVLISPEKSTTATRYAKLISFEEMCARVEAERMQPLNGRQLSGVNILADFITYERYGEFSVIPYAVIRKIYPGQFTRQRNYVEGFFVHIEDTFSNSYEIVCYTEEDRQQIIYNLDDALHTARKNGGCL